MTSARAIHPIQSVRSHDTLLSKPGLAISPIKPEIFSGSYLIPKMEFLVYDRHSFSVRMEDFDLNRCTLVLKVIDAFFDNQRGFRKTLGELKGFIVLLKEGQPALSQVLSRNWSLLHEFDAKMVYRRSPGPSQEQRALIDLILIEMKSHILEAIDNQPNLVKPASANIVEHTSVGKKQHSQSAWLSP